MGNIRNFLAAFGATAMLLAGAPATAQETIKFGILAPFKTPPGEGLINAASMAASKINEAGGIDGKQIELIISNTEYKPEAGVNAYKKLVLSDKVAAVIGTASSGVSMAIIDQVGRYRVPMITTGGASLQLSDKVEENYDQYKYWFRVMHTTDDIATSVGDWVVNYLHKERGLTKAAILSENALWAQGVLPKIKELMAEVGIEVVSEEFFGLDTKDYKPILSKINNTDAEFILDFSSHVDGATYVKQWGELQGPLMAGLNASGTSSRFWGDTSGNAASHVDLIQGSYRAALTENTVEWFDQYVEEFGVSPDYTSGYTYDAIFILADAIKRAGSTEPDAMVEALEASDYTGVSARWVFEKNHNSKFGPGYRVMGMTQWQLDGEREVIWPSDIKTADFILPPWQK